MHRRKTAVLSALCCMAVASLAHATAASSQSTQPPAAVLREARLLPWEQAVEVLSEQVGTRIPLIEAHLGAVPDPHSMADALGGKIEATQVWWTTGDDEPNTFMVFQNVSSLPLRGLQLELSEGSCAYKGRTTYHTLRLDANVPSGWVVAANFTIPREYRQGGWRCINIVRALGVK